MVYKMVTGKAPVNIAVIKYWGKSNEPLKIPVNDSISGTLSIEDLCATTTVIVSDSFDEDQLWLNKIKQNLEGRFRTLIDLVRNKSSDQELINARVHIFSENNFPTAAGLASSAAGFACLAFVLGNAFGLTDRRELSIVARIGSGSACRSLYGGFVRWHKGHDSSSSVAEQLFDQNHWPEIRVLICVANEKQKDISSSLGMKYSADTSELLKYRADKIVPLRIGEMEEAISSKDFESFGKITMRDSNQFHAICLDTEPTIHYLNDVSRSIIRLCVKINEFYGKVKVAYTFDAGPNACIFTTEDILDRLLAVVQYFHPPTNSDNKLRVEGRVSNEKNNNNPGDLAEKDEELNELISYLKEGRHSVLQDSLSYIISTRIGEGPKLVQDHLNHP